MVPLANTSLSPNSILIGSAIFLQLICVPNTQTRYVNAGSNSWPSVWKCYTVSSRHVTQSADDVKHACTETSTYQPSFMWTSVSRPVTPNLFSPSACSEPAHLFFFMLSTISYTTAQCWSAAVAMTSPDNWSWLIWAVSCGYSDGSTGSMFGIIYIIHTQTHHINGHFPCKAKVAKLGFLPSSTCFKKETSRDNRSRRPNTLCVTQPTISKH